MWRVVLGGGRLGGRGWYVGKRWRGPVGALFIPGSAGCHIGPPRLEAAQLLPVLWARIYLAHAPGLACLVLQSKLTLARSHGQRHNRPSIVWARSTATTPLRSRATQRAAPSHLRWIPSNSSMSQRTRVLSCRTVAWTGHSPPSRILCMRTVEERASSAQFSVMMLVLLSTSLST